MSGVRAAAAGRAGADSAAQYGISEEELSVARAAAGRRAANRAQFLRHKLDPHASGYVFDPALQRYQSMIVTQYEFFKPTWKSSLTGLGIVVVPMLAYGWLIWNDRNAKEQKYRSGEIRYRDRAFKLQ